MINAITNNLETGKSLLTRISEEEYRNNSVPPYYSSIGGHVRHILDIFNCIFDGLEDAQVDLTARQRNQSVETNIADGLKYFGYIIDKLNSLDENDFEKMVSVTDDLGQGKITKPYTLAAALIQAHSHAIHHFAALGYVLTYLGLELPDADFGFNPTTPREKRTA